jgi:hypothetical protein
LARLLGGVGLAREQLGWRIAMGDLGPNDACVKSMPCSASPKMIRAIQAAPYPP